MHVAAAQLFVHLVLHDCILSVFVLFVLHQNGLQLKNELYYIGLILYLTFIK